MGCAYDVANKNGSLNLFGHLRAPKGAKLPPSYVYGLKSDPQLFGIRQIPGEAPSEMPR
jgi:hypothetical protein